MYRCSRWIALRRRSAALLACVLLATLTGGCVRTVIVPARVGDPVEVLFLEHGRSTSLVLPLDDERQVVRYAYGDYHYYALAKRDAKGAFAALFLPTDGALGRRFMPGSIDPGHVVRTIKIDVNSVRVIEVERAKVRDLIEYLGQIYDQADDPPVYNDFADLTFRRHPRKYSLTYNSKHAMTEWLILLGCEVRGWAPIGTWRVLHETGIDIPIVAEAADW